MTVDSVAQAKALSHRIIQWRRHFHQHPEVGLDEHQTTAFIVQELTRLGYAVERPLSTGAVAVIEPAAAPSETLAFRADIDALPMQEDNPDLPYQSQVPGVCHACGHDAHTAMLLGTAALLAEHRADLRRKVELVFQPCEERLPGGAKAMVEAGVAKDAQMIFAIHVNPTMRAGTFEASPGPVLAAADEVTITITGRGGHGAYPHLALDPVPVAAQVILALQTLVSRRVDPLQAAVVSICQVNAGTAFNIIPPEVRMVGTLRTLDEGVRRRLRGWIDETAGGIAQAAGATATVTSEPGMSVLVNDEAAANRVADRVRRLWGSAALLTRPPEMGAEDFSFFTQVVPGCFIALGVGNPALHAEAPHHSPRFRIDESVLWMGTALFADLALNE